MRRFVVNDRNGKQLAEGIMFSNDQVAVSWKTMVSAVVVYPNIHALKIIHGEDGNRVVFVDNEHQYGATEEDGSKETGTGTGRSPRTFTGSIAG